MAEIITEQLVWSALPVRDQQSHKGSFGRVLSVAGSTRYRGAAALSTEGILRGGAGLVTLATVEPAAAAVLPRLPEAMILSCRQDEEGGIAVSEAPRLVRALAGCSALLMGPGMGNTPSTAVLVDTLVRTARCPVVLDADALSAAARMDNRPYPDGPLILTPHPGEMARLCQCSIQEIEERREEIASRYAKTNNCVLVLKGHRTLVAGPCGECWQNATGNAGLATGGSGDVLAGLITAFVAQGVPALKAAQCAVYLHGAAADACSARLGQYGMLPHDMFTDLGRIFAQQGR